MPRRPAKSRQKAGKPRPAVRGDAKIKKWNKPSDIPMDEEEEFHASRDHILLDGGNQYDDEDDMDEEVFALKGMDDDDSEEDDMNVDEAESLEEITAPKEKKKKQSTPKSKKADESDEEEEESGEEEETWGRGKHAYYADNADELESDDDEANEMEEQEARRLQSKSREDMDDADFGLADNPEIGKNEADDILVEEAPKTAVELPQDKKALIRHLEKTNPETLALARDWEDTVYGIEKSKERIKTIENKDPNDMALGMMHLYYQTLLTYATTLAFYFRLRVSPQFVKTPESLRAHPIMSRLLTLKQALSTMEDLDFAPDDFSDDEDDFSDDGLEASVWDSMLRKNGLRADARFDASELADLLADAGFAIDPDRSFDAPEPAKKKRKTSSAAEEVTETKPKKDKKTTREPVFDLIEPEFTSSKTTKKSSADFADAYGEATSLQHADAADKSARKKSLRFHTSKIESASAKRKGARDRAMGGDDDIPYRERRKEKEARLTKEAAAKGLGQGGEDLEMVEPPTEISAKAEKSKRVEKTVDDYDEEADAANGYIELIKRTIKRKRAENEAIYKAKHAERISAQSQVDAAVLEPPAKVSKKAQKSKAPENDEVDYDEEADAANGYYELIQRTIKKKRAQREAEYAAANAKPDFEEEQVDGPRSLTRAILANKGLTPHRPKSVRNPRVKKRLKFEKAKKKLSSQKAVFKGGLAQTGRYDGEKSGISKVVKSIRLG